MTINDFKNLDEMPWGKHRLMGDFSLRQNETALNHSYWNIIKYFQDEIFEAGYEDMLVEQNMTIETYLRLLRDSIDMSRKKGELYSLLCSEHVIPLYIRYSGIVKGLSGDCFVMEIIQLEKGGTVLELYLEIFASYEEMENPRQKYIDFELSKFKEYINEDKSIDERTKQFILDIVGKVLE